MYDVYTYMSDQQFLSWHVSIRVYTSLAASEDVVSLIENADQIKAKLPVAYETGDRPEIISWRTAETQIRPPLD